MKRYSALVLVFLASCTVGPDYQRPAIESPKGWQQGTADPSSLADLDWWRLFNDPILNDLITRALTENFDARLAAERVLEFRSRLGVTEADLYPRLDAGAAAGVARDSAKASPALAGLRNRDYQTYQVAGALSWELDLFGRIRRAAEADRALLFAAEEDRHAVAVSIVAEVSRAYMDIRDLDARIEISRATVVSRKAYVDLARLRFQGGKTSELDFRQAEAELGRTQSILAELERLVVIRENDLSFLLGRSPGPLPRGKAITQMPVPPQIPAGLPSDLLQRRPDIRVAEQQLIAANARIGEAKALMYPQVTLTATAGYASTDLSKLLTSPASFWQVIGGITAPIWDWGKNKSRVEEAEARMRQAVILYEQSIRGAFRDVEDALSDYRKYGEKQAADQARVTALRQALTLSESRYRGGVSPYLEVLDAQRTLFDAELELSVSLRDKLNSVVRLYRALGGGWQIPPSGAGQ